MRQVRPKLSSAGRGIPFAPPAADMPSPSAQSCDGHSNALKFQRVHNGVGAVASRVTHVPKKASKVRHPNQRQIRNPLRTRSLR
jgi:hypothetical protein